VKNGLLIKAEVSGYKFEVYTDKVAVSKGFGKYEFNLGTTEYNLYAEIVNSYLNAPTQEALDILKTNYPDVIILDIMMPMVDGFATLEQIRKDDNLQHTKVMFLSAKNKESDIKKGLELGADAYMTKPFSIKKVVEKVEELLS
jgi:DNA-binding response OmpR family regulator